MSNNMLGRPGDDLLGLVQDFITKIRNGSVTKREAKRFLRREDPWTLSIHDLSVFALITIGGVTDFGGFANALAQAGCDSAGVVKDILGQNGILAVPREVELVSVSVADLGLRDGGRVVQIYQRAEAIGLELCPSDTAPQLVLQRTRIREKEIAGKNFIVAMRSLQAAYGSPCGFTVSFASGPHIGRVYIDAVYAGHENFIFVRPKKDQ